jgi:chromosome segregation ATPase
MKIHNEFLAELVKNISAYDLIKAERIIHAKSEDFKKLQTENKSIKQERDEALKDNISLKAKINYLEAIVNDFKEATQCPTTITHIKEELSSLTSTNEYYKQELERYKKKYDDLEKSMDNAISGVYDDNLSQRRQIEKQLDDGVATIYKLKEEVKELTTKREAYVNTRVEKEAKKLKDKMSSYKDEIDELQEQVDTLTRENKRLKRNTKKTKVVESDTESD